MAVNDKQTKTEVQERHQPAADPLPAAFDEDQPATPLAIRPVERGGASSATGPRYPRASTELARRESRSDLAAPDACASHRTEDETYSCCCECPEGDDDPFGDSPGGHVTLTPDPLADRLAAVFGGPLGEAAARPALGSAATSARATARGLAGRQPACLPPHVRKRPDGETGGDNGDA
jgi:hypothetical protein